MAFKEKETTIIHQDDEDTSFYIIVSGTVRVENKGKILAEKLVEMDKKYLDIS
jgi:hypothetical protein